MTLQASEIVGDLGEHRIQVWLYVNGGTVRPPSPLSVAAFLCA